jgi:hypothetical protein
MKEVKVLDYAVNPKEEEEIFMKNKKLIPYFRIGLSIIEQSEKSEICRRGLIKLFEFKDTMLNMSLISLNERNKKIQDIILKPITERFEKQEHIDIYKILKLNGYNTQISFCEAVDSWVFGTKNYSCLVRNKQDLDYLNYKKYIYFFT